MSNVKTLLLITGIFEIIIGVPVLGGLIVINMLYVPLVVMLALHIVTLVLASQHNADKHGSILGIVTSVIAIIPVVGMIMHLITGVLLLVSASKSDRNQSSYSPPPPPSSF